MLNYNHNLFYYQNQKLTFTLQSLQNTSKETREQLSDEVRQRQDEIYRLRDELKIVQSNLDTEVREKNYIIDELKLELTQRKQKVFD